MNDYERFFQRTHLIHGVYVFLLLGVYSWNEYGDSKILAVKNQITILQCTKKSKYRLLLLSSLVL